ncbi:MAG: BatA domain-containing protein, partial [Verrucomicrobiia bacterium]
MGLLVLAAIPALVVLHMLHRRRKPYRIATLFLLRESRMRSEAGRKLEKPRSSPALWLQLAASVIAALLAAGPGCVVERAVQHQALVLDGAASLQAFRDKALTTLMRQVSLLASGGGETRWLVIQSGVAPVVLYRGSHSREMLETIRQRWHPLEREHDMSPAVQLASSIVGGESHVIVVSDREPPAMEEAVGQILVGEPLANVGIIGASLSEEGEWQVMIRNMSGKEAERSISIRNSEGVLLHKDEL